MSKSLTILLVFIYAGCVLLFYSYLLLGRKKSGLLAGMNRIDTKLEASQGEARERLLAFKSRVTKITGWWFIVIAVLCMATGVLCFVLPAHTALFALIFACVLVVSAVVLYTAFILVKKD